MSMWSCSKTLSRSILLSRGSTPNAIHWNRVCTWGWQEFRSIIDSKITKTAINQLGSSGNMACDSCRIFTNIWTRCRLRPRSRWNQSWLKTYEPPDTPLQADTDAMMGLVATSAGLPNVKEAPGARNDASTWTSAIRLSAGERPHDERTSDRCWRTAGMPNYYLAKAMCTVRRSIFLRLCASTKPDADFLLDVLDRGFSAVWNNPNAHHSSKIQQQHTHSRTLMRFMAAEERGLP